LPPRNGVTELDLIPADLIVPRLRAAGFLFVGVGVVIGVVMGLITSSVVVGVLVAAAVAFPCVFSTMLTARRRTWIEGATVTQRSRFRTHSVDFARAVSVELIVKAARVSQILLRVGNGQDSVTVPLALYTETGGRELEPIGLRTLANALSAAELVPAAAAASVLITQLRAEARDAGLSERPLYTAVTMVKNAGRDTFTVLTDAEVAALTD
jgi:hypothetical protein